MTTTDSPEPLVDAKAEESNQRNQQIARSTLVVMIAFGAAKVISLAQTFIIADAFGAGAEWDAFVTANRIPELIFTLIAGGGTGTRIHPDLPWVSHP